MEVNLIPPIMMRLAGLIVDECPKFLAPQPSETNHSVYFPQHDIRLHFHIEGIISYLPTRIPSNKELKEEEGGYLLLTPNQPIWDPHTDVYRDQESSMIDYKGHLKPGKDRNELFEGEICALVNNSVHETATDPHLFISAVQSLMTKQEGITYKVSGVNSSSRKGRVSPEELAKRLNIPLEMAKRTIRATTQLAVRTVDEASLTRKFRTNDRMLRYIRLSCNTFMDTFLSSKRVGPSARGYTTCQVFATEFGHVFVVPMEGKSGSQVAQAIKRYFKEVGVPVYI